ncbi:hypothetical protein [uncultured Lamprocystis sp.]|uniref:hypothetical protein n=2 Tax=uncultured Lamprocystis sp. TaxID=543132 RepID=UPI0025E7684B|nr:hypothetical protein [uncultured Lamprocystis sp.]
MAGRDRSQASRERMAYEAARIMVEQGEADFDRARRKAAERTGVLDRRGWPTKEAIADALLTQRRLFQGDAHARDVLRLRSDALQAMRTFRSFSPRLVGPVLRGSGQVDAGVQLCLHADCSEDLVFALMEQRIPWQQHEHLFRYGGGERRAHPVFRFVAGTTPIELIVLPRAAQRNPPLDPVTERPERGADIAELERLLNADDGDAPRQSTGLTKLIK